MAQVSPWEKAPEPTSGHFWIFSWVLSQGKTTVKESDAITDQIASFSDKYIINHLLLAQETSLMNILDHLNVQNTCNMSTEHDSITLIAMEKWFDF